LHNHQLLAIGSIANPHLNDDHGTIMASPNETFWSEYFTLFKALRFGGISEPIVKPIFHDLRLAVGVLQQISDISEKL
jgi:hypothetical protein